MSAHESDGRSIISIDSDLYAELRDFCDRLGIRFVDFVEDALANATRRHETERLLNDAAKVSETIKIEQQSAFLQGFKHGVLAASMSVNGDLSVSRRLMPRAVKDQSVPKAVTGGQMKLFE
jgi:hypothetical protein